MEKESKTMVTTDQPTQSQTKCPCYGCPKAITCNWTCDALNEYAKDKTFAEIASDFIEAYKLAARHKKARKPA